MPYLREKDLEKLLELTNSALELENIDDVKKILERIKLILEGVRG